MQNMAVNDYDKTDWCWIITDISQPRSKAKSKVKRCKDAEDPKIRIPGFKVVEGLPQVREPEGRQPAGEQAYIRHIEKSQEELEERVEYDLDSEDEEWLKKRQKKVRHLFTQESWGLISPNVSVMMVLKKRIGVLVIPSSPHWNCNYWVL